MWQLFKLHFNTSQFCLSRSSQYLNLQLGVLDLQQSSVLSSLSLLVQIQLCIQQFLLCLNILLIHIRKDNSARQEVITGPAEEQTIQLPYSKE